jgi:hypothetical protein
MPIGIGVLEVVVAVLSDDQCHERRDSFAWICYSIDSQDPTKIPRIAANRDDFCISWQQGWHKQFRHKLVQRFNKLVIPTKNAG